MKTFEKECHEQMGPLLVVDFTATGLVDCLATSESMVKPWKRR